MDPNELRLCWDLLKWASLKSDEQMEGPRYADRLQQALSFAGRFGLFQADDLEKLSKTSEKLAFPPGRSLLLAADTTGAWKLPVLKVTHDVVEAHEIIRFEVCLIILESNANSDAVAGEIGVRFETPEGAGASGLHGYHHAQWCSHFRGAGGVQCNRFRRCQEWLPDVHPAIPVAADGPLSLLVALFVALYGRGNETAELTRKWAREMRDYPAVRKLLG